LEGCAADDRHNVPFLATRPGRPRRRRCWQPAAGASGYFDVVVGVVTADGPFAVEVVGVEVVGVEAVGVLVVGVEVVGVLAVGVDVVGAEAVGVDDVPVAGSVFGGSVVVVTSDVSPETATNAAATPPRPSTKITVMTMIGMRQLPGRSTRVVAA
jgi:hypothetical protein